MTFARGLLCLKSEELGKTKGQAMLPDLDYST